MGLVYFLGCNYYSGLDIEFFFLFSLLKLWFRVDIFGIMVIVIKGVIIMIIVFFLSKMIFTGFRR